MVRRCILFSAGEFEWRRDEIPVLECSALKAAAWNCLLCLALALGWSGIWAVDGEDDSEPMVLEAEKLARQAERKARQRRQQELMELACRDELDRPESWMDRTHSYLSQRLCEPAAWFDGFFGDPRSFEETPVGTFFRIRNELRWDQTDDFGYRLRIRANISLPRISERVRLLVTRDEDITGEFDDAAPPDERDDRTRLGLRFIASERARSQFDIDGTVRVSGTGLNPRVRGRYRYVQGLSPRSLARATQSVFWEREDGFGATTRLDWEWLPDRDTLLRVTGQGTFSEASDGVDWRAATIAFRQLTTRTALRGEIGAFGFTRPDFEVEEYFVALRYRRQVLRRWLFFELQPEHAWPLDPDTGSRRADWRFTFTLEVQFENEPARERRLRRYLGEDFDLEDWPEDEPVPVDVPGERAVDEVLEELPDEDDEAGPEEEDG